jgi:HEAT repeat protein
MKKAFYLLLLVTVLTSCAKKIIIGEDEALLKECIKNYDMSSDWEKRADAVNKISRFRSERAYNLLLKATYDIHYAVVIESLKGLAVSLPQTALDRIKYLAEFEENDNVRWYALRALAEYRDSKSAPVFVIGLNNRDWLIREASIRGLLMIDDYAIKYVSIPYIIEALKDKRINVRITTLEHLDLKDKRLYETIVGLLPDNVNRNSTLLEAILKALRGYTLDSDTRNTIINLMTHQNKKIRLLAFRVLREEKR